MSEGIRQTIGNQKPEFIRPFFTTVQLVMAGNDVEGLRYGVDRHTGEVLAGLARAIRHREPAAIATLTQLCSKERLLELIHDFIVFDAGVKKICRHNQYFGVKAAQERIAKREGGIIWHTQGSGKSLTMVWLAKWIREHQRDARVLLITDRTELDEQIEKVFNGRQREDLPHRQRRRPARHPEQVERVADLLADPQVPRLRRRARPRRGRAATSSRSCTPSSPRTSRAKGNLFVFVDEAHRTQSGKMHDAMKELLPGAMFIGFTGTPLLKADKATSIEIFGSFIHTYKFDEAVAGRRRARPALRGAQHRPAT